MTDSGQRVLFDFDVPEPPSRLRRQYLAWRATKSGEVVFGLCRKYALEKLARGQRFGIGALCERVRWDFPQRLEPDDAGYRLNNNHRAFIARDLVRETPGLRELIEMRRTKEEGRR
jgi:hypothetical protein